MGAGEAFVPAAVGDSGRGGRRRARDRGGDRRPGLRAGRDRGRAAQPAAAAARRGAVGRRAGHATPSSTSTTCAASPGTRSSRRRQDAVPTERDLEVLAAPVAPRLPVQHAALAALVERLDAARRAAVDEPDDARGLGPALQVPHGRARRPAARLLPLEGRVRARHRRTSGGTGRTSTATRRGASRRSRTRGRSCSGLHTNGWVLALEAQAPKAVKHWRGPVRGARRATASQGPRASGSTSSRWTSPSARRRKLHGLQVAQVRAGAARTRRVELRLDLPGGRDAVRRAGRDRARRARATATAALQRYDALVTGWCRLVERYTTLGTPPVVVFVCEDEPAARELRRARGRRAHRAGGQGRRAGGRVAVAWPAHDLLRRRARRPRGLARGMAGAGAAARAADEARRAGGRACELRRVAIVDPALLKLGGR